jgi:TRAP-type C4-dicarboxylate transport system substrate-binding protein
MGRKIMRRTTTLVAGALATVLAVSSAWAQQKIGLTIAAGQPPSALPSLQLVSTLFIPEVNKRIKAANLGVEIEWKEAYAGSLLKPYQMLDGVKDGLADMGMTPTIFFPDKLPLETISFFVPFLTTDPMVMTAIVNQLHKQLPAYPAQFDKFNQVRLGGSGVDSYELLTTFPVRKVEDLKGRKISTAGAALAWLRGTGATPVQANMMEYYNSIKTGVYEGTIMFPSSFAAMKYPEVAPYMTKVGFGAQHTVSLTMNKDVYRKLPEPVRKIMHEVAELWGVESDKAYQTAGEAGYKSLPGFKAQLYELPEAERLKWAKMMPNIAKEWAQNMEKQGLPGNQALAIFMQEARKAGLKPLRDWDKE